MLLAEIFNTDIISCDARQFYRELSIGSSFPDKQMLYQIQHNFIGHLSIWNSISAGYYQKDTFKILNELFTRLPIILMVGGSGLYGKIIIKGIDYLPFITKEVSRDFHIKITRKEELKKKDTIFFESKNFHRFLRSLDILSYSNRSFSSFHQKITIDLSFKIYQIVLNLHRDILYDKINKRVDNMIKCGFLEEVQECYSLRYLNALKTIGYKDFFNFFDGKISFEKAIEGVKKNTRNYAKRQLTWYKKEKKLQWFIAYKENDIIKYVKKKLTKT